MLYVAGILKGSPPRPWGQRDVGYHVPLGHRFTPTCVGTTASSRLTGAPPAVHPHVRGDNEEESVSHVAFFGSPPRAWGQRFLGSLAEATWRFTHTCVGTTEPRRDRSRGGTVHPHVRGDNEAKTAKHRRSAVHPHVRGDNC